MARSEICKFCCPSGGAVFKAELSRAFMMCDEVSVPKDIPVYAKVCQNCHTEKPLRHRLSAKAKARRAAREALLQSLCA